MTFSFLLRLYFDSLGEEILENILLLVHAEISQSAAALAFIFVLWFTWNVDVILLYPVIICVLI